MAHNDEQFRDLQLRVAQLENMMRAVFAKTDATDTGLVAAIPLVAKGVGFTADLGKPLAVQFPEFAKKK